MSEKPIIRWAGSKRKLLPTLLEHLPAEYERYVEPFCGSACLFFAQNQKRALLSDFNGELTNALLLIKRTKNLHESLINIPPTKEEYYRQRSINPEDLSTRERAIRFLYLNRYCFNGVYRTNMSGQFNVPRGTKTGDFPANEVFENARKKLRQATIKTSDYTETLASLCSGDFVYIDPPYSKSGTFTGEYGVNSFTSNKLNDLIDQLHDLNSKGVKFLFSYRLCEETTTKLSKHYHVENLKVKRHISGFKKSWDIADEILVKNYG
ncbi:MAG: Dam family site-specific DNA-(adenine-N6)-methyltransferase [Zhongshania sp.]|nr:Dam family site-specific DNA-(adenine-N6)-methyltransferase [Zhongshania sp.]